jgi:hypothetical protein
MKKIYFLVAGLLLTVSVFGQVPQKMSYQAVIRNSSCTLITSTPVGMKISVLQGSATGTVAYSETQIPTTNANGLVSLEIGNGIPITGTFAAINWANGPYFIKTETDPTGGTNYTITGTSQLLSLPYALYAKTAESISGTIPETDPTYTANFNLTGATTGDLLRFDGSKWVAQKAGVGAIISKLANAPTTYLTIGNYQFRYSSTSTGGFIEVKAISGSDNMMVYATKNSGSWDLAGSSSTKHYRNNTSIYSGGWLPVISLWNGSAWNDRVTLSTYETFEATIFSMGNGDAVPSPLKVYKLFATIDGYNQVFLRAEYNKD